MFFQVCFWQAFAGIVGHHPNFQNYRQNEKFKTWHYLRRPVGILPLDLLEGVLKIIAAVGIILCRQRRNSGYAA